MYQIVFFVINVNIKRYIVSAHAVNITGESIKSCYDNIHNVYVSYSYITLLKSIAFYKTICNGAKIEARNFSHNVIIL